MNEVTDGAMLIVELVTDRTVILVFSIVFVTVLLNYALRKVLDSLQAKIEQTKTLWDDALFHAVRKPLAWLIWVLGIAWAAEVIASQADTGLAEIVEPVRYVAVVSLIAVFLTSFAAWGLSTVVASKESGLIPVAIALTIGALVSLISVPLLLCVPGCSPALLAGGRILVAIEALCLAVACVIGVTTMT